MILNKKKSGILPLSYRQELSKYQREQKAIKDIPYVKEYQYLGITVNRAFQPKPHLSKLKEKISKFDKLMFILRAQKAKPFQIRNLW